MSEPLAFESPKDAINDHAAALHALLALCIQNGLFTLEEFLAVKAVAVTNLDQSIAAAEQQRREEWMKKIGADEKTMQFMEKLFRPSE